MSIAYKHLSDRVPKPSSVVPALPEDLDGFVASATERDRELRPESASAMRHDIEAIEPELAPARSLAGLVDDMPEIVDDDGNATEAVAMAAPTATQTITRTVRMRRRRWRTWLGVVLAIVALAASASGIWTYVVPHKAPVPDVMGATVDAARSQLADEGFVVKLADGRYTNDVPADHVIRITPPPGTVLSKGDEVTLVPSLGPPPVDVPTIEGKPLDKARTLVDKAGLRLAVSDRRYDDTVPADVVISQDPASGRAGPGRGRAGRREPGPAAPTGSARGRQDARRRRGPPHRRGLPGLRHRGVSTSVVRGRVIGVSPDQGVQAPYGSTVTLTVSKGPETFPAPDFGGLSRSAAQSLADQYGLILSFATVPGTSGGIVYSQSPGVGTVVRYGDTITLYMV